MTRALCLVPRDSCLVRLVTRASCLAPARHDAFLCFAWALPHVTDEIQNLREMMYLSYVDFLEATPRACSL